MILQAPGVSSIHADRTRAGTVWVLVLGLLCMLRLSLTSSNTLGDADTLWHLSTGKLILETLSFPHVDSWSHTFAGQPWMARDWLSQVILQLGYLAGGWPGTAFVTNLAASLSVMVVGHALIKHTNALTMLLMGWLALLTLYVTLLARPHMIGLPAMALWTALLVHASSTTRRPPWLALGVMALWSNLHAGFTIGYIIAGAIALDAIWKTKPAERLKAISAWLAFGCGCLMASLVNPYGHLPLLINIRMFAGNEAMAYVSEWEMMRLHEHNVIIVAYAALLIGSLFLEARKNIFRILLGLFIIYTSIKHERFVMLLAIIPPLLAQETAPRLLRLIFDRLNLFQDNDPLLAGKLWKPVLLATPLAIAAVMLVKPATHSHVTSQDTALASVPQDIRQGPVFNSYNLGGFLVSRNVPTFIDGRTDQLFLGGFMNNYMNATGSSQTNALEEMLNHHGITWAFIQLGTSEAGLFDKLPGWKQIHANDRALVYVKTSG